MYVHPFNRVWEDFFHVVDEWNRLINSVKCSIHWWFIIAHCVFFEYVFNGVFHNHSPYRYWTDPFHPIYDIIILQNLQPVNRKIHKNLRFFCIKLYQKSTGYLGNFHARNESAFINFTIFTQIYVLYHRLTSL